VSWSGRQSLKIPDPDPPFLLDFTDRFEQELELLLGLPRGAEVLEGLEQVLKRDPHNQGQAVPESDLRVIQVETAGGAQQFSVFYRVEGRGTVKLLSLYPVSIEELG
jgi:hypothetical protein